MPKVSVIVPNYNHARFLRQRLESILHQTFQDFELILLDDCSTDDSRTILSSYASHPRVTVEFNKMNSGSTFKQWNKGVSLARGKYVWIAESDDYADEHLLGKLVSRLDADPSIVLCYCRSWQVSEKGALSGFLDSYLADIDPHKWTADFRADGEEECRKYLLRRNTVLSASSIVFRKEVYDQVGGADESLTLCGDWKTWAAMALTGGAIAYVGEPLNYYRFHDTSVTIRSQKKGVGPVEALLVIDWILKRVKLEKEVRENLCAEIYNLWGSAVLDNRIPIRARWAILKSAKAVDHHALWRLIRPAFTALRLTVARRWRSLWGGLLERTDGAGR
jgi:glycosyltransferase involved in cell wall biosynthesis